MTQAQRAAIELAAANHNPIDADLALAVLEADQADLPPIYAAARALKQRVFGQTVHLCSVLNARSGHCPEDCRFCAQSAHFQTAAPTYKLLGREEIHAGLDSAAELPIARFGLVTSGRALAPALVDQLAEAIGTHRAEGVGWCASLGMLDETQLTKLASAGMTRFHHNLETAESFFPQICSTHTYQERIETLRAAKRAGLSRCCGGILGMGESLAQRVELALAISAEEIESITLNFLIAIPGTPLADQPPMSADEILRATAMFRLTNPAAEIRICGGRMLLGERQAEIYEVGGSGMMMGKLLTTSGQDVAADLQMLADLELVSERHSLA
jgi:biotin synthase